MTEMQRKSYTKAHPFGKRQTDKGKIKLVWTLTVLSLQISRLGNSVMGSLNFWKTAEVRETETGGVFGTVHALLMTLVTMIVISSNNVQFLAENTLGALINLHEVRY